MFDEIAATQVATYFLKKFGGKENYTKILKLMYLADRQLYIENGESITGDRVIAMGKGPVLKNVYDLIKGRITCSIWNSLIELDERDIKLIGDTLPENPKRIVDILDKIFEKHGKKTYGQLIDYTHELPEWIKAPLNTDIMPKDILAAVGKTEPEIEIALKRTRMLNEMRRMAG